MPSPLNFGNRMPSFVHKRYLVSEGIVHRGKMAKYSKLPAYMRSECVEAGSYISKRQLKILRCQAE